VGVRGDRRRLLAFPLHDEAPRFDAPHQGAMIKKKIINKKIKISQHREVDFKGFARGSKKLYCHDGLTMLLMPVLFQPQVIVYVCTQEEEMALLYNSLLCYDSNESFFDVIKEVCDYVDGQVGKTREKQKGKCVLCMVLIFKNHTLCICSL
jgi:hypothetical protein